MEKETKKLNQPSKSFVCSPIQSKEELEVCLKALETALKKNKKKYTLSAPELGIDKSVAIVRTPNFSFDLINPKIIEVSDKIISFGERCFSFDDELNCFRYYNSVVNTGLVTESLGLKGYPSILAQHAIDHLHGTSFYDRVIKMALVREGGVINSRDYCPCGSGNRFFGCCQKT